MTQIQDELYVQAVCLTEVILRTFEHKGKLDVTSRPAPKIRPVVSVNNCMKVVSLGRFDGTTYISVINFYLSASDVKSKKSVGALIIYIGEKYIVDLFAQMGYPGLDEDNEKELEDAVGTFCNIIAGKFKLALMQLGFMELEMTHFLSYQNEVKGGVAHDRHQTRKYEIVFEIENENALIAELTLGRVPKRG
jgi:hypothetical protein